MKNRKNVLWLVGVLLFGMVSAGSVMASTVGEWAWNGEGSGWTINLMGTGTSNQSLYVTNDDNTDRALLATGGTASLTYLNISGTSATVSYYLPFSPTDTAILSKANEFRFAFATTTGAVTTYNTSYSWAFDSDANVYTLSSGAMSAQFLPTSKSLTVTPVPIPGSALLLGSGVIGLLGIGSRRKKD